MLNFVKSINYYGTYTLALREILRFFRVYNQTIIAPVISALIFLCVFVLAIGSERTMINDIRFIDFMSYGLIIMTILQNSFANSSSSLIMSKVIGYIEDILIPPLSGVELVIAFSIGAIFRGIIVGIVLALSLTPVVNFILHHPYLLIFFVIFSSMLLGQLGILTGIASSSFDQSSAITSYIITPLSFLSGTFYSIDSLPNFLRYLNNFNPFFYMIDGFRYCLTNNSDSNIYTGIAVIIVLNVALFIISTLLLDKGWNIKS